MLLAVAASMSVCVSSIKMLLSLRTGQASHKSRIIPGFGLRQWDGRLYFATVPSE